jgi:hypothetical protein
LAISFNISYWFVLETEDCLMSSRVLFFFMPSSPLSVQSAKLAPLAEGKNIGHHIAQKVLEEFPHLRLLSYGERAGI